MTAIRRKCDVVMKGGITSGIVYPRAIARLSDEYTLRNVGGTSAGAIAAAAAAAAEHGRRTGSGSSFDGLCQLPDDLRTRLVTLFQPKWTMKPFLKVMLAAGRPKPGPLRSWRRLVRVVATAIPSFGFLPLLALLPPALILTNLPDDQDVLGWLAIVVICLLVFFGAVVVLVALAVLWLGRALAANYLGMCSGYDPDEEKTDPPLTTWLTCELDALAGTSNRAAPLTFGDLWGEEAVGDASKPKDINLEVITTSLTHGAPLRLPTEWEENTFWFDEREFGDLFPRRVVKHMVDRARPSASGDSYPHLHHFPAPNEIPVVVAIRMSLSFPLLISAIPVLAKNFTRSVDATGERVDDEKRQPERCWLSDGGIVANFPIHLFDSPVPRWPTFGVSLRKFGHDWPKPGAESDKVHVPATNGSGWMRVWNPWDGKKGGALVQAFLGSILDTSRNWLDRAQARGPGFRDRIATIGHDEREGGMNLEMDRDTITAMSGRGKLAAEELINHFAVPPQTEAITTWENQRWARHRSFLGALEKLLAAYQLGIEDRDPDDPPLLELIERPNEDLPSYEFEDPNAEAKRTLTRRITEELYELTLSWRPADARLRGDDAPAPLPELGARPRP